MIYFLLCNHLRNNHLLGVLKWALSHTGFHRKRKTYLLYPEDSSGWLLYFGQQRTEKCIIYKFTGHSSAFSVWVCLSCMWLGAIPSISLAAVLAVVTVAEKESRVHPSDSSYVHDADTLRRRERHSYCTQPVWAGSRTTYTYSEDLNLKSILRI